MNALRTFGILLDRVTEELEDSETYLIYGPMDDDTVCNRSSAITY